MFKCIYNGEKEKVAGKNAFGAAIKKMVVSDPKVVYLDADLMNSIGTYGLDKDYPDQIVEVGIQEANMIGVAAGMSAAGMKPIAHTFGSFAGRRVFDQAFMSVAYAKNNVVIIGSDSGINAAYNGGTHMPFEDMALYRAMPEATVYDITDVPMLIDTLRQAKDMPGVKYIRVPRASSFQIYAEGSTFTPGKGVLLREGTDVLIVASGIMVKEALEAAKKLSDEDGIEAAVIDPVTVKPLDAELIREWAEKTGMVVTAENHNRIGGLTSAVEDALIGMPLQFGHVAVEDCFGEVGPVDYLREQFQLTDRHICRVIHELDNKREGLEWKVK